MKGRPTWKAETRFTSFMSFTFKVYTCYQCTIAHVQEGTNMGRIFTGKATFSDVLHNSYRSGLPCLYVCT